MLSLFIALNAFLCIMFNSLFGFRQWKIQTKGQCQNFNYVIASMIILSLLTMMKSAR